MSNVLVTGGTGFIGNHLVTKLLKEGHRVTVVSRRAADPHLLPGTTVVSGFFGDQKILAKLGDYDGVFHLAACTDGTDRTREVNVDGTAALAEWTAGKKIPFFFFASSIEAQGPGEDPGKKQTARDPCRPIGVYGQSKLDAEQALVRTFQNSSTRLVIARIGNVYGPGGFGFIRPLMRAAMGGGQAKEQMMRARESMSQPTFVRDLVGLMIRGFESGLEGIHYFVGDEACSVGDWFDSVYKLLGAASAGKNQPEWEAEIRELANYFLGVDRTSGRRCHRVYDSSALFEKMNRPFRYSLLRGTAETLAWMMRKS